MVRSLMKIGVRGHPAHNERWHIELTLRPVLQLGSRQRHFGARGLPSLEDRLLRHHLAGEVQCLERAVIGPRRSRVVRVSHEPIHEVRHFNQHPVDPLSDDPVALRIRPNLLVTEGEG